MSLAVTGALLAGERVGLRAENGLIVELGPGVPPRPGDDVARRRPARSWSRRLINGHTHAAMTLFRGYGDDLPLMRWLEEKIWPIERKLEPEDVYWGTRLACLEMIRSGTVRFWDMYWHPEAAARAVHDAGMRATVAAPLIDVGGRTEAMREAARRSLDELAGEGERIDAGLAPHAIYTVSEDSLRWIAELAAERGIPVQIHLSETEQEVIDCVAAHRRAARPLPRSDRAADAAHGARARRVARRGRARADRRARRRSSSPTRWRTSSSRSARCSRTAGARRRRPGRARHRRSRLEQLARPVRGHEGARAAPEARGAGRARRSARSRPGRSPPAGARRCSAPRPASRSGSRPTSCCCAPARPSSASASCRPRSCTPRRARSCRRTVIAGRTC